VEDTTEPDSKRHQGNSLVSTSHGDRGTSVEGRNPGSLSANSDESQAPAANAVDTISSIQPAQLLSSSTSGSISSEGIRSSDGTLPSSEPVTEPVELSQEVSQNSAAPTTASSSQESAKVSTSSSGEACKGSSSDEILESLLCVICQEILYKCVR